MTFYDTVERVDLVFVHTCETWITFVLVSTIYGKKKSCCRSAIPVRKHLVRKKVVGGRFCAFDNKQEVCHP